MLGQRRFLVVLTIFLAVSTVFAYQSGFQTQGKDPSGDGRFVLWTDPGNVQSLDFKYGVGGPENQPKPPFRFVDEDLSGTNPKVNVVDERGAAKRLERERRRGLYGRGPREALPALLDLDLALQGGAHAAIN